MMLAEFMGYVVGPFVIAMVLFWAIHLDFENVRNRGAADRRAIADQYISEVEDRIEARRRWDGENALPPPSVEGHNVRVVPPEDRQQSRRG